MGKQSRAFAQASVGLFILVDFMSRLCPIFRHKCLKLNELKKEFRQKKKQKVTTYE